MFKIIKEGELILGNKFQILSLEDNQENGMQVMEVTLINSVGEADTRRIGIV